jgi:membrane-associated phospholipid phosphatase
MSPHRARLASRALALTLGVAGVGTLVLAHRLAVVSATGQRLDDEAMRTVYAGADVRRSVLALLGNVSIGLVVAVAVGCIALALVRGRARWAVGAIVVIGGANVSTQVLKHVLLHRPDLGFGALNSLPSGHTTVVASATAATLLVAPSALRPLLVLGGAAATTLTGTSTIAAGWHRPSDVVAALAVALVWTAAASFVLSRRPVVPRGTGWAALLGSAGGVVALAVLGVRPTTGWSGFPEAAAVLGSIALAVTAFTAATIALAFDDDVSRETDDAASADSAVGVTRPALAADRAGT